MSAALTPFEAAPRLNDWTCRWCRSPMESERVPDSHLCPRCEREYEERERFADEEIDDRGDE